MAATKRFRALLMDALTYYAEHGYTNEAELQDWLLRLRYALEKEVPTDQETRAEIASILQQVFKRDVDRLGVIKRVPGVSKYTLARIAPNLRAELDRRIFAAADLIKLNKAAAKQKTLQRFSGWVTSVPRGGTKTKVREVAADVLKPTAQLKYEKRRVAIDQGHKLSASISAVVALQSGAIAAIWHDRGQYDHGYDARPEHLARSGKLFLVRDSWAMNDGMVKKNKLAYTDEIEQPAQEVFCFPGLTRVPFANGVRIGYRRWYTGELTEIVTQSGKTLRATPNHPILTTDGWVAVGLLKKGDYIIECSQNSINGVMSKVNNNDTIPTIAQIFTTLQETGTFKKTAGISDQFHGDGTESDVDIVNAAWPLSFNFVTTTAQSQNQLLLALSDLKSATLRSAQLLLQRNAFSTAFGVSGLNAGQSPFGRTLTEHKSRGFTDTSYLGSSFTQTNRHCSAADATFGGQRLDGLASFVSPSQVVEVKRGNWSGHVYNLETKNGWYAAEGIISHNCSCYWEYIDAPRDLPAENLTAKGRAYVDGRAWVANAKLRQDAIIRNHIEAGRTVQWAPEDNANNRA